MSELEYYQKLYRVFNSTYWGNKELQVAANCGATKTSELMQHIKTIAGARVLKHPNKVRRDKACEYLNINVEEEKSAIKDAIKFYMELEVSINGNDSKTMASI